jgi:hypothetical protein
MVDWIEEPRPVEALVHRDLEERLLKSMHVSYDQVAAPVSNSALECVWLRRPGAALLAFAVVTLLTACSRTELKRDNQIYKAYGDTWVYSKTEIHKRYLALYSPHGWFGVRNGHQERHLIRNSAGKTISIPDNLYALQRDGTLKKIECCQYFRESGDLYNIDDRLVFIFDNARKFITDCFIYPAGRPDNELRPPEQQVYGVTVFAEFDPEANAFKISTFFAGDNYLPFEYRAAELRTGRQLSIPEHNAFLYARRKPFICDGSAVPSAPSTQPPLAFGAYQSGATRTVQISVTPAATRSLVDRLQTFASRKGFKAWQAGSVERRDVSLALRRDEILTVAAGDDTGLWRVALYRRMPPPKLPSDLPSEESVDALLREVRNELGELPGVRFVD